jgi:hypothetical protein
MFGEPLQVLLDGLPRLEKFSVSNVSQNIRDITLRSASLKSLYLDGIKGVRITEVIFDSC